MASEAQRKASAKYDKANTMTFAIKLNRTTDAELIQRLEEVENKQGYIKRLIREDAEREKV